MQCTIDASSFGGAPLTKKFAMFNSGLVPMSRYRRDINRFDAIAPRSLRIDLFIGQDGVAFGNTVGGTAEQVTYDFAPLDELAQMLNNHGVLPYWAWCYIPKPVQVGNDFRSGPSDLRVYAEILEQLSAHYKQSGIRLGYQEVYNEPDCSDIFFTGSYDDYIKLYEVGAPAIRRGDPDAVVGGPSSAFVYTDTQQRENLENFLDSVRTHGLPLDFFSYHSYGYQSDVYAKRTLLVREMLTKDDAFSTTELHMNELNAVPAPWDYQSKGGALLSSRRLLPLALDAIRSLAAYTDLTLVSWAQLLDSGVDALGLVDTKGVPRPAYTVFEIFERMPVRRLQVNNTGDAQVMASADENRVSLLLWHKEVMKADMQLDLHHLPFEEGTVSVYMLDEAYFETYTGTLTPLYEVPLDIEMLRNFQLSLEKDDAVYIEINREKAPTAERTLKGKTPVRSRYYFANRASNTIAWHDERNATAYLGMGSNDQGLAVCASEIDVQDTHSTLSLPVIDLRSAQACLSIRLDYATESGYVKAVAYSTQAEEPLPQLPFGTQKHADLIRPLGQEGLQLDLLQDAPPHWNGRLLVTFLLKDAGADSWVTVQMQ